MPNHFHMVVKTKSELDILDTYNQQSSSKTNSPIDMILSNRFSNLFNSYAQAYNNENDRKGSLFFNRFKRKTISDEKYLAKLIHYLHYNPVEAGLVNNIEDWKFSSYKAFVGDSKTLIAKNEVIKLFESRANFIYCHKTEPTLSGLE